MGCLVGGLRVLLPLGSTFVRVEELSITPDIDL